MTSHTPLIITERRLLPRLIDATVTVLAWAVFAYLFLGGINTVLQNKPSVLEYGHFDHLFASVATLANYLVIGLVNALLLLGWALYNQHLHRMDRSPMPRLTDKELRNSFSISARLLKDLREHQICSVHHDSDGNIVGVRGGSVYANHGARPKRKSRKNRSPRVNGANRANRAPPSDFEAATTP